MTCATCGKPVSIRISLLDALRLCVETPKHVWCCLSCIVAWVRR